METQLCWFKRTYFVQHIIKKNCRNNSKIQSQSFKLLLFHFFMLLWLFFLSLNAAELLFSSNVSFSLCALLIGINFFVTVLKAGCTLTNSHFCFLFQNNDKCLPSLAKHTLKQITHTHTHRQRKNVSTTTMTALKTNKCCLQTPELLF